MNRDQRITLRLQAHNIITIFLMEQGLTREAASKAAFKQVRSAPENLLKKILAGYKPHVTP